MGGKQKPTLLILIFVLLIGVGAWAGGILIWCGHGSIFAYCRSFQTVDITQSPMDFPPIPMALRTCGDIAVPVIEIQVLLNAPDVVREE